MSGVHTESNFMTVRQHEVCAKPEGSQSQPLTPEERLTETEGEGTSHTNADGAQTERRVSVCTYMYGHALMHDCAPPTQ